MHLLCFVESVSASLIYDISIVSFCRLFEFSDGVRTSNVDAGEEIEADWSPRSRNDSKPWAWEGLRDPLIYNQHLVVGPRWLRLQARAEPQATLGSFGRVLVIIES
jgi:hypothetical protein